MAKKPKDPWDRFYTPVWCVDQMVELVLPKVLVPYPGEPARILDPGAGHGVFTDKLRVRFPNAHITAIDIDPAVGPWSGADESLEGDFLETDWASVFPDLKDDGGYFDLIAGNPPFAQAREFILESLQVSPMVIYFLRQGFMSSARRSRFFKQHPPSDVFILADRPGFDDSGNGDKADYAWLCWSAIQLANRTGGTELHWLPPVDKDIRRPK